MFRSTSDFDKQLEKATSQLLLEPDWQSIIQICDIICQGDCQPKYALSAIKKKFYNQNPHVALYAFQVLESVVKNCGSPIHDEVATKGFMDELREMVHKTTNENIRAKILELIQTWAMAFRNSPKYRIVQDTLNILKAEGYSFPTVRESDAMFVADRAPTWSDGDNCHRCRVAFTVIVRKHHCRACGQVFCGKCTPKSCTLPKYGIEREVRVCEDCFEKHNPENRTSKDEVEIAVAKSSTGETKSEKSQKEEELKLQEEEELQLAIALSRSEAEQKEKERDKLRSSRLYSSPIKESPSKTVVAPAPEIEDPELARYLNRSYWEQKQEKETNKEKEKEKKNSNQVAPSAPVTTTTAVPMNNAIKVVEYQNGDADEVEEFVDTLRGQLEIFVNRMKSNSSRGRSIANDSSVQTLFLNITAMHSRLMQSIQQQEDSRAYYEGLQDKLAQARDARAALDALREEHCERLRREAEEAERQRQLQMAQKLEIMRKKKQEYLQYQRQLAIQRMQEEERELQMRLEQQKQMYLRGQPPATLPQGMPMAPPNLPGYPPHHVPPPHGQYMGQPVMPPFSHDGHNMPYGMQSYPLPNPSGGPQPGPGGPPVMPGPYGAHPAYAFPPMGSHPIMYPAPHPQTATAPAATGHYAAPPSGPGPMMMAPPASQQPQPQMADTQQPAVAELISFD